MTPGIIAFFTIIAVLLAFYAAFAPSHATPQNGDDVGPPNSGFNKYVRPAVSNFLPTAPAFLNKYAYSSPGIESILRRSGNPWRLTPAEYVVLRLLSAAAGATVLSIMTAFGLIPIEPVLGFFAGAATGYIVPSALLATAWGKRRKEVARTLPEALDLLRICMSAGYNFTNSLGQIVALLPEGTTRQELSRVLSDIQSGKTVTESLDDFAERIPTDQVDSFVSAVSIANSMGTDMARTLAAQADEARAVYERKVEQKAQKLQTTLFIPIIAMLLPSMMIIIFAPAMSEIGSVL